MILSPFINLLLSVISLYSTGLIVWIILGLLVRFNIINSFNQIVRKVMQFGSDLYEPILRRIRRFIPPFGGVDLSPVILILVLELVRGIIISI